MVEQHKFVVMCTTNLPQAVVESLSNAPGDRHYTVAPYEPGLFVSTWPCSGEVVEACRDMEPELETVLRWAAVRGFRYVQFDRDAEVVDDLPEYDWG